MSLLPRNAFVFIVVIIYLVNTCRSISKNQNIRIADPNLNKLCESYSRHAYSRGHKFICLVCKGFDISCFSTTKPVTTTTTTTTAKTTLPSSVRPTISELPQFTTTTKAPEPEE
ncbi:unnamed protein product [Parnassius apollo]|uniref:(apollo) hypothetical protein n=1 Tax=Parnassius apollo TaxID=110799 RepID=A0A8S3XUM1_PARAO|nr:unnamed protein product [Parnassius apollo]